MTDYTDRDSLVEALCDMGFARELIEVHDKPQVLSDGKRQAHVIVRRANVKSNGYAYTDLGYELMPDGKYKAHIDEYTLGRKWQGELHQRYDRSVQLKRAQAYGHKVSETTQPNGDIVLRLRR